MTTLIDVYNVYSGSDGKATKALYARLEQLGAAGAVAANLFRAHKSSARAKVYRGGEPGRGSYRKMAYGRKEWSLGNLVDLFIVRADELAALGLRWGWAEDPAQEFHRWVFYIDIPTGQVSFHTAARGAGPDYAGEWDGVIAAGAGRICRWIADLLTEKVPA